MKDDSEISQLQEESQPGLTREVTAGALRQVLLLDEGREAGVITELSDLIPTLVRRFLDVHRAVGGDFVVTVRAFISHSGPQVLVTDQCSLRQLPSVTTDAGREDYNAE